MKNDLSFYKNKKVLITGHSGFKGIWLSNLLNYLGAEVYGYSLIPEKNSFFYLSKTDEKVSSCFGDIRDFDKLHSYMSQVKPEIVIHMAAQAIVNEGYENPAYTYDVNMMGTVNILECIRKSNCVKSFINVTTDKVYRKKEDGAYKESDVLGGYDPYANSKSVSEMITETYKRCFIKDNIPVSCLRSGNAIGGGDFSDYRLIPDCLKAYLNDERIVIRNPQSVRPYQHVLNVLYAYLIVAMKQYDDISFAGNYNIGPDLREYINNEDLISKFIVAINKKDGIKLEYIISDDNRMVEEDKLYIDNQKFNVTFGKVKRWSIDRAMIEIADFIYKYKYHLNLDNYVGTIIEDFLKDDET